MSMVATLYQLALDTDAGLTLETYGTEEARSERMRELIAEEYTNATGTELLPDCDVWHCYNQIHQMSVGWECYLYPFDTKVILVDIGNGASQVVTPLEE